MNKFEVIHAEEALEFLYSIEESARNKILYNITRAKSRIDPKLFKKLDSIFWEFRTEHKKLQFRMLAFWHKTGQTPSLVITTHGFIKKSDRVPLKELGKAYEIRRKFLDNEKETKW